MFSVTNWTNAFDEQSARSDEREMNKQNKKFIATIQFNLCSTIKTNEICHYAASFGCSVSCFVTILGDGKYQHFVDRRQITLFWIDFDWNLSLIFCIDFAVEIDFSFGSKRKKSFSIANCHPSLISGVRSAFEQDAASAILTFRPVLLLSFVVSRIRTASRLAVESHCHERTFAWHRLFRRALKTLKAIRMNNFVASLSFTLHRWHSTSNGRRKRTRNWEISIWNSKRILQLIRWNKFWNEKQKIFSFELKN